MIFEGALVGSGGGTTAPLHAGEGLTRDLTVKSFIFTAFYKGFSITVRFWR